MNLTENAVTVLERRIAKRDTEGNPLETPEDIFKRVAHNIALAEMNYISESSTSEERVLAVGLAEEKFYNLLSRLDFMPNSPTLVNAGHELQQLSACFVLPVEDSMEGIFEAVKQAALIHKTGGGTGFSFSRLRPANSNVSATSGIASGPVSFMQVFDKATEVIKQGGTRRGANMGILRVDHPDILEFIHVKDDLGKLNNFNISVAITDKFMAALEQNNQYDLIDPKDGNVVGQANARDIWNQIISSAHATGDPGVIFIDRINSGKANPVPTLGPIESTNPCGEQPLYPWDSCNLGSINLSNFVYIDGDTARIDFPRLADVTADCVHFLDNVIDMNNWPNPKIHEVSTNIRRIGLGVMGWADALIKMKIPYDSEEAVLLAESTMECISTAADRASIMLAMKRGSFPAINDSIYRNSPMRHSTRTTIAPTGTISIIAGVSSGIEPIFALEFVRSHFLDKDPNKRYEMVELHPAWAEYVAETPEYHALKTPDYFHTANQISPEWHVRMQAAFQKHTDNAVSKTINFAKEATVKDVETAYWQAWHLGCNGITVYRDGSRDLQVLTPAKGNDKDVSGGSTDNQGVPANWGGAPVGSLPTVEAPNNQLPDVREKLSATRAAINHKFTVGEFEGYISVGMYSDGRPGEVFIVGNKAGTTTRGYLDTIGVLISRLLQQRVPINEVTEKLEGIRFEPSGITSNKDIPVATSIIDYLARWLRRAFVDKSDSQEYNKMPTGDLCPECGAALFYAEGCSTCLSCFYSKCG